MAEIVNDIRTFANCGHRTEEILPNDAFCGPGFKIGMTTDPGLLDWSECGYDKCSPESCEANLSGGTCPMKFPY